jgi:hypothetical protein
MKNELLIVAALTGMMSLAHADDKKTAESTKEMVGECFGVNSCKSTGACAGKNDCAGKNECKGKGWVKKTEKECKELKGTFKKM